MKFIKKHKELFIYGTILLIALIYTSFNTFLANDDLPYMYLYRGDTRITNIIQVLKNQVADYMHINGRFFVHVIVQTLLIFGKKMWAILNPIVITTLLLVITLIIKVILKETKINYRYFLLSTALFLLMINYKYIIYWVSGSVNYIWVSLILFLFLYYYLKKGLDNKYLLNAFIILGVSILHEMTLVFMIIFMLGHIILKKIKHEKIDKKYLLYLLSIIISTLFIMLSPGNRHRMGMDATWASLNIFEKIGLSLPVVSYNLFNIRNYHNIIPTLFIISIAYKLFMLKEKKNNILAIILLLITLLSGVIDNSYLYIDLAIISFISIFYIQFINKDYNLIIISLGFYAMVYSTIITPNYMDGRPNLFFDIYAIMMINVFINNIINMKYTKYFLLCLFILMIVNEVYVYHKIGNIHRERLSRINACKETNCSILSLPKMSLKYNDYHIDPNSPQNKKYYTYRYYLQYYKLPDNIVIKYE